MYPHGKNKYSLNLSQKWKIGFSISVAFYNMRNDVLEVISSVFTVLIFGLDNFTVVLRQFYSGGIFLTQIILHWCILAQIIFQCYIFDFDNFPVLILAQIIFQSSLELLFFTLAILQSYILSQPSMYFSSQLEVFIIF